jgi:hypothetical protein
MFARKPFLRAPKPPLVRVDNQRATMVGSLRDPCPKEAPKVRSEDYRRFVASQRCFGCKVVGYSQCCHMNVGKGLALKVCDLLTFPLCGPHWGQPGCHTRHDLSDGLTRDERRALEVRYVQQMQAIAKEAGRPEFA